MNRSAQYLDALAVIGTGEATVWERDLFDPSVRTVIRYADPAAWITATAVARSLAPIHDSVVALRNQIGLIVISQQGPAETISEVAAAARSNLSSPLRYPAANPGSMVGVSCIALGLHGPTLNLTMPLEPGIAVALSVVEGWVRSNAASVVMLATCGADASQSPVARCHALAGADFAMPSKRPLRQRDVAWLCAPTGSDEPSL